MFGLLELAFPYMTGNNWSHVRTKATFNFGMERPDSGFKAAVAMQPASNFVTVMHAGERPVGCSCRIPLVIR